MTNESIDSVRVCVRIRPFVAQEMAEQAVSCVHVPPNDENQLIVGKDRQFTFDHVFPSDAEQSVRDETFSTTRY